MATSINSNTPRTYLQFCEEQLDPERISRLESSSHYKKIAAIVTTIALSSLVTLAFAGVTLFAPALILVAGGSSLFLLWRVKEFYASRMMGSEQDLEKAEQLKVIQKHHQNLLSKTPTEIQQLLRNKEIHYIAGMGDNDPKLTQLTPLIARYLFWEDHSKELEKKRGETIQAAAKVINNRTRVYELQSQALELESQALEAKVKNAFIHAVICRPDFKGTFEGLGAFSPLSGQERAIALAAGSPKAEEFFTFKGPSSSKVTFSDVKQYTTSQLAILRINGPLKQTQ